VVRATSLTVSVRRSAKTRYHSHSIAFILPNLQLERYWFL